MLCEKPYSRSGLTLCRSKVHLGPWYKGLVNPQRLKNVAGSTQYEEGYALFLSLLIAHMGNAVINDCPDVPDLNRCRWFEIMPTAAFRSQSFIHSADVQERFHLIVEASQALVQTLDVPQASFHRDKHSKNPATAPDLSCLPGVCTIKQVPGTSLQNVAGVCKDVQYLYCLYGVNI